MIDASREGIRQFCLNEKEQGFKVVCDIMITKGVLKLGLYSDLETIEEHDERDHAFWFEGGGDGFDLDVWFTLVAAAYEFADHVEDNFFEEQIRFH